MNQQIAIILPAEVQELAVKVSATKQTEVNTVLNQIFTGTAEWENQVDAITVKDINDKMSIQLADVARKNIKSARLVAEKVFDAKREEVQQVKAEYDLEDKLWLKAKQVMQIKFKAIEEKAEWKANFVKRYEAEQAELKTQIRIEKVAKYNSEINRIEFEHMSDQMFEMFVSGLEKAEAEKIEAAKKLEEERIAKEKADAEMRAENERLKIEAEKKAIELEKERAKAEAERKQAEEKARKEREAIEAKLKAEKDAREKAEAEIMAKAEAEKKAEADRIEAEKKAAKAPKKTKMNLWIESMTITAPSGLESDSDVTEIINKFNSFKNWAKTQVNNL